MVIPSTIDLLPVTGIAGFGDAGTSVAIPSSVTNIGFGVFGANYLTAINVSALNPSYSSVGGVLLNKSQTTLIQCPARKSGSYAIPNTVMNIGAGAFIGCENVTSVTIPNGVLSIGDLAFFVSGLIRVTIPDSVIKIGTQAFYFCPSLTNAIIGNGVTAIPDLAFFASGLNSVTIGNNVTSIGDKAFNRCPLASVTIPNSVTHLGFQAFGSCGLTSVVIGSGVRDLGAGVFRSCDQLTSVTISNGVSAIGAGMFSVCWSLPSITIPNSVTNIGASAFWGCHALTNVTIPDSVITIEEGAFDFCTGLASVTLGHSVAAIQNSAFTWCSNLTGVYFKGDAPSLGGTNVFFGDAAIVYYLPGTLGWGPTFGGSPTALWSLPYPLILSQGPNFGVLTNQFGFIISWAYNPSVMVEACTNLANNVWAPVATNTLTDGAFYFSDPHWTNYPSRFYRLRSP